MTRELKVVLTIFMVYFIYGLSSLFSLYDFVTPFFLAKITLVFVSSYFLLTHLKTAQWYVQLGFTLAMLLIALQDPFVHYLFERWQWVSLPKLVSEEVWMLSTLMAYYAFFYWVIYLYWHHFKAHVWTVAMLIILSLSITFRFNGLLLLADLIFDLFLVLYFLLIVRKETEQKVIYSVLAAQFLLIVLLEIVKYPLMA
jgi:hypothetical protein